MARNITNALAAFKRQSEESTAAALAARLGVAYVVLDSYPLSLEVLSLLPLEEVESRQVGAYIRSSERVRLAVVHGEDPQLSDYLKQLSQRLKKPIEYVIVSPSSMRYLIATYRQLVAEQQLQQEEKVHSQRVSQEKDYFKNVQTLEDLQKEIEKASITEVLDVIIAAAVNQDASDIHFEPGADGLTVRFRIDGVLQRVLQLSMQYHHPLVSRIKVTAKLKLDEQKNAQDGRFSLLNKGIDADVRVSTIPTGYGEGVVLRILRKDSRILHISELGFSAPNQELIEKAIRRPYGLILVTGPTGSGKSTTLYGLLQVLNSSEKKIITLEDPIEYQLEGVEQTQVNPEAGYTFAEGLKGILRQDPDIVMVGEIRDPETATIALNASLTGHLILSTLHTNNAVTAPIRFLELGIAPFLLTGSIQLVIAQRLVRKVVPGSPPDQPQYHGRTVISEVLVPNPEFEQAVLEHRDQATLQAIATRGGMIPMLQDGLEKVRAGITTEAEVYRVTTV